MVVRHNLYLSNPQVGCICEKYIWETCILGVWQISSTKYNSAFKQIDKLLGYKVIM